METQFGSNNNEINEEEKGENFFNSVSSLESSQKTLQNPSF